MQRILTIVLPFVILIVLGFGGSQIIAALAPKPEEPIEKTVALSVFVEPALAEDVQLSVTAQGVVKPVREVNVAPQVAGKIEFMNPSFEDGGAITRGEELMRLEQDDYRLAVVSARAAVASAQQRVVRERAEGELARQDIEELGFETVSELALRKPQMAEAQAALDSAKAQLADAELALSRTILRAPFTGLVSEKMVDAGQFVSPGQSLGRVFDTSAFEIYLPIQDADFAKTGLDIAFVESAQTPGPLVKIYGSIGGQEREWAGRVIRTGATINAVTRQIGVFVRVDDPFGAGAAGGVALPAGLFVDAEIFGERIDGAVVIPRAALRAFDTVYVADKVKGELRIRTVDVAQSNSKTAVLRSGIAAGEFVITSLIDGPSDAMKLRLLRTGADGQVEQIPLESTTE